MKVTNRIYLDAALQNIKSVAFFVFLQVLIARLGASNFQIALSTALPPLFCALSLAFLTRQLPVTRGVYLVSGYIRQIAFLCMALSVLLPNPLPVLLFFWCINAVSVMVTGAQQPAILRRWVEPADFPRIFSMNKMIGIVITVCGSFLIGHALESTEQYFPYNYSASMLLGCLATFTGMALIAGLAPHERKPIKIRWLKPLQECNRTIWWMGLNNIGIAMMAPLFIIYHIKQMNLTVSQISYFVIAAGVVSALLLPIARVWIERFGIRRVYGISVLCLAISVFPYGWVSPFWLLLLLQGWIGLWLSIHEVSAQTMMMNEAAQHKNEMAYFSDFHLVMNAGNAIGAMAAGLLLIVLPVWACFCTISVIRVLFYFSKFYRSPSTFAQTVTLQYESPHTKQ